MKGLPDALSDPPSITAQEMRRIDVWSQREFHLTVPLFLDHSGRVAARFLRERFALDARSKVLLLVGKGHNGAVALATGRWLRQRGIAVEAALVDPPGKLRDEARKQLSLFRRWGGTAPGSLPGKELASADLVVDGVVSYGIEDQLHQSGADVLRAANAHAAPRFALDLPSGLNPDSGKPGDPTFRAHVTLTFGFPKEGLRRAGARKYVGELYLADIGVPRTFYEEFDTSPEAIFGPHDVVRVPT